MRVVQFESYGPPEVLRVAEAPMPEPGPGEVRVRVCAAAVNPADWKWRSGALRDVMPLSFPHVLGYDVAGEIDAMGEGVEDVAPGLRVCGMLSHVTKGGYADYALLPAAEAVPIPDTMDFATAAALPCAGLTGVQMIEEQVRPTPGQRVLITGALGGVGRFALHAAVGAGAHVIAVVRGSRVAEAIALGAAETHIFGDPWIGPPVDHVVDTVGGGAVAALCRQTAPRGRIVTAATAPIDPVGLSTAPVFVIVHHDAARLAELVRTVAAGELAVPVAKCLPLAHAAEAHRLIAAGSVRGKIVLLP